MSPKRRLGSNRGIGRTTVQFVPASVDPKRDPTAYIRSSCWILGPIEHPRGSLGIFQSGTTTIQHLGAFLRDLATGIAQNLSPCRAIDMASRSWMRDLDAGLIALLLQLVLVNVPGTDLVA